MAQQTWGRILIWLGILAWAPYVYLLAIGQKVSILPFLALHLAGLLSGGRLRSRAAIKTGNESTVQGRKRRFASNVLIFLGVLAWAPYIFITRGLGQDIEIAPFLIMHLTGVVGGLAVRFSISLDRFLSRS